MKNRTRIFTINPVNIPLHYLPEEENGKHAIDRFDCKCNPKFENKNNTLIIIHHPFDKNIPT